MTKLGAKDIILWSIGLALMLSWAGVGAWLFVTYGAQHKWVTTLFPLLFAGWIALWFGFVALVVHVRRLLEKN